MSEPRKIDSSLWTGDLHSGRRSPLPVPWVLAFAACLVAFPLYLLCWHLLWLETGSPAVAPQRSLLLLGIALVGGAATLWACRKCDTHWPRAVVGGAVAAMISSLVFYATDFLLAEHTVQMRYFVEGKGAPSLKRRNIRFEPELRLRTQLGRSIEMVVPRGIFDRVTSGDSCIIVTERAGTLNRFPVQFRVMSAGDGTGHWMQVDKNRRTCLSRR